MELTWSDIKVGKSYRIVTTYCGGAVTTFQGRIDDVILVPSKNALIHHIGGTSGNGRTITIVEIDPRVQAQSRGVHDVESIAMFRLPDPLPERDGAIIMHDVEDGRNECRKAMLVRIAGGSWVDVEHGGSPRRLVDADWTLLFMPGTR